MLPSFLKGTYAIYKEDTDSVASWLASTARRCGYSLNLLDNAAGQVSGQKVPKKKKKKKKNNNGKALNPVDTLTTEDNRSNPTPAGPVTYTIAIKDFVSLAEHIVAFQKPPVKVPTAFVKALDRAIALRKKHNSWFNDAGQSSKADGHAFFLDTLERVHQTLKSRVPSNTIDEHITKPSSISTPESSDRSHIGNIFEGLTLEEPSNEFLSAHLLQTLRDFLPRSILAPVTRLSESGRSRSNILLLTVCWPTSTPSENTSSHFGPCIATDRWTYTRFQSPQTPLLSSSDACKKITMQTSQITRTSKVSSTLSTSPNVPFRVKIPITGSALAI